MISFSQWEPQPGDLVRTKISWRGFQEIHNSRVMTIVQTGEILMFLKATQPRIFIDNYRRPKIDYFQFFLTAKNLFIWISPSSREIRTVKCLKTMYFEPLGKIAPGSAQFPIQAST